MRSETGFRLFSLSVVLCKSGWMQLIANTNEMLFITSAFGVHLFDVTESTGADRVYCLHGHLVLGAALQPVHGVREPVGIHVHPLRLVAAGPVSEHVASGNGVWLFDRLPLDEYGAGRDGVHVEFGRGRRMEHVDRVRYLIPAEHVLHVTRVIARVRLVVHGAHAQAAVR